MDDDQELKSRLEKVVFRLSWHSQNGKSWKHGTGFFISPDGIALTAFHNIPDWHLIDGKTPLAAEYQDAEVELELLLRENDALKWQREIDVAVLKLKTVGKEAQVEKCCYLCDGAKDRVGYWRDRKVRAAGYPESKNFGYAAPESQVTGMEDVFRTVDGHAKRHIKDALVLRSVSDQGLEKLQGMSGGPVYDMAAGGIVGVVLGVQRQFYAIELMQLVKLWEPPKIPFVKIAPPSPPSQIVPLPKPIWWRLLALPLLAMLGWFVWPVHLPVPKQLEVDVVRLATGVREKLTETTKFMEGERVRFIFTPPARGYVYVVDQEIGGDGEDHPRYLIFPTSRTGHGRNLADAGTEVSFPDKGDDPPYLEPHGRSGDPRYGGEELTILVYKGEQLAGAPDEPLQLSPDQFADIPQHGLRPRIFQHPAGVPTASRRIQVAVRRPAH